MLLILVAGGPVEASLLKKVIEDAGDAEFRLAGIDAGVLRIEEAGMRPDMVIGDFDSVSPAEKARILTEYPDQIALDPVKDDTDMEAAVHYAVSQKPERVVLLGALGKRMDHTMTNLRLLSLFAEAGISAVMQDERNRIRILTGNVRLLRSDLYGPYISLLPVSGAVKGITLRGFKYPLTRAALEPFSSLGVSNELTEAVGEIEFEEGLLYLMETKD